MPDKADDTAQRVEGDLVIDAKSIDDSMYGASEPLAMEEERTAIEMMGIQEGMRRMKAMMTWRSKSQRWTDQRKRQRCSLNAFMVTDMFEEMVRARKRRQQRKTSLGQRLG